MAVLEVRCPMCDEKDQLVKHDWRHTRIVTKPGGGRVVLRHEVGRPRITCRNCRWTGFLSLNTD